MDNWIRDLRLALRQLAHAPGFAAVAILTLAVGIGANVAIFSVVNGALLQPLSYPQPQQLVSVGQSIPQFAQKYPHFPANARSYYVWSQQAKRLTAIAVFRPESYNLTGAGEPTQIAGVDTSADIFQVLGMRPLLGRAFTAHDDTPNGNNVVILTYAFWQSHFHGSPGVLGKTVDLDGHADQIIGVMPASFYFPYGEELGPMIGSATGQTPELLHPLGMDYATQSGLGQFNFGCFARLRPGVTAAQARAEMDVIEARMLQATHADTAIPNVGHLVVNTVLTPLRDQMVGSRALGLWLLLGAVGAILLIVCLNLANLMFVRVHGRSHEIAIRLALGASRGRLLRETMTEGVLLALIGGALGVAWAEAAVRWLVHAAPAGVPRLAAIRVDGVVLAFAFMVAVGAGVLFSLWPALRAAKTDPQAALRAGGRSGTESRGGMNAREWLVGAQAALSAALLIVAGLLTASFVRLMNVNKGYQTSQVVVVHESWPGPRAARAALYAAAIEKLGVLPGVSAVGMIDTLPANGVNDNDLLSYVHDPRPALDRPLSAFSAVSPGYFAAMGIPILRGRTFTAGEVAKALLPKQPTIAALVSAYTAAQMWPGQSAIGKQFTLSDPDQIFSVVGVVGDVRSNGLAQPPGLQGYWPFTSNVQDGNTFVLRTASSPASLAPVIRRAIWSLQPGAVVNRIQSMDAAVGKSVASRQFQMWLVLAFALCALFLAALGIYGVVAYSVARRRGELGIRLALGADGPRLFRMVLGQGLRPVGVGLVVGVLAALASWRLLASLLFGVHASDPTVIASVCVLLLLVAAAACAVPAHRASRTPPVTALHN